ncbi:MAG TPA: complex I subunit 5 family protein [Phycisphaerae bacterium]|nr:complex I subunit 5 family protein [Phycisphaerae bacterium]
MNVLEALWNPLVLPITVAMVVGLAAYVLSRVQPTLSRALGLAGSIGTLICGITLVGSKEVFRAVWVQDLAPGVSLTIELVPTTLGMVAVIGSAAFAVLIAVYSVKAMAGDYWEGKFYAYLLWTLGGACLVGLAGNLLVLLVGWEIVTLMLFLMVNQGRRDARSGAAKAYGVLGFTDACVLLAIALLAAQPGGSANWSLTRGPVSVAGMGATGYVVYLLIMMAALAKAGAIPLHTWIPSIAEDAPAPVMALLPAAMDKLLGIYLLGVLALQMFRPDGAMQLVMMIVGAVTILAAVLMAMIQHNLKRLLSFHAVSQVGYMVLGIGTGTTIGVIGGLFHMVNHAIYKSNLFLMSGTIRRATGSDEIEDMGGLAKLLPITFTCGAISALAISGVPPFNGFYSKWMVYQGALSIPNHGLAVALVVVAVFGSALTLASFVKVIYSAFLSPVPQGAAYASGRMKESLWLVAPMVVLAVACVVLGIAPGLITEDVLAPAVAAMPGAVQAVPEVGLWQPSQATTLIVIGFLIGLGFLWVASRPRRIRIVRPFLGGEVPVPGDDRFRVPGTHFYETVAKLPGIGPLLFHGGRGAMDLYYWSGKHGNSLVQMLRAQHTGLVSLYVAWCLVGLTATLVYLLISAGT